MQFSLTKESYREIESGMGTVPFLGGIYMLLFAFFPEDLNLLPKVIRKHGIYHWRVGLMTIFELGLNYISFEDICLKNVKI